MPVVTGSGLTNASDVIEAFHNEIAARFGANYTAERNTGTVGSNNKERWWTLPTTHTSTGERILYGLCTPSIAGNTINVIRTNSSTLAYATASAAGARAFDRFDGQPMYSTSTNGASTTTRAPCVNGFNTGANYLRHWIITNPNFGAAIGSYAAGERLYIYMVVEITANVFRTFGFGELIQIGNWPTTASGLFLTSTYLRAGGTGSIGTDASASENMYFGCQTQSPSVGDTDASGGMCIFQPDRDGVGGLWLLPWQSSVIPSTRSNDWVFSNEFRRTGRDALNTPSVFSGVAGRMPIRCYASRMTAAQVATWPGQGSNAIQFQPVGEFPDAFFCNIRDLNPGTVLNDGGEKFLILPFMDKAGVTVNNGFLLRNAGL